MERKLGVSEARKELARIIDDVRFKGDHYVILKHDEPAAAVVPMSIYLEWKQARDRLFETIREIQADNAGSDPDEVMAAVLEAQHASRPSDAE